MTWHTLMTETGAGTTICLVALGAALWWAITETGRPGR